MKMNEREALAYFFSSFDAFTCRNTSTQEDWIWHILLCYVNFEDLDVITNSIQEMLSASAGDHNLFTNYVNAGGPLKWRRAADVRPYLEAVVELAPRAKSLRASTTDPSNEAWMETPRPRLAREVIG
jgi:hypothetical protein